MLRDQEYPETTIAGDRLATCCACGEPLEIRREADGLARFTRPGSAEGDGLAECPRCGRPLEAMTYAAVVEILAGGPPDN